MTKRERNRFIRELCNNVRNEILAKSKQMPKTWDGIELRAYIADYFNFQCRIGHMNKRREKEYRNTIYITNL